MEQEKLNQLIESANEGDASSQYDLAEYYKGVEDYFNALTWYIKAAEQGHEKALSVLFAPVEIEDKCNVIEIKPFYVQKAEEEEKARLRELEELKRKAAEANRKREEEARRKAEEEARLRAEEEARRKAEEEARRKAEEEARRKAAEVEARRKAAEEEARRKAEEEARRKAEEEARRKAEEEARRKAEEEARRKAEEEARRKAEEEARRKAEEEARRKAEEEARRKAEEEARRSAEDRKKYSALIAIILSNMILIEGGKIRADKIKGPCEKAHTIIVNDFCISKEVINYDIISSLIQRKVDKNKFDCYKERDVKLFCKELSRIMETEFSVPTRDQLLAAYNSQPNAMCKPPHSREWLIESGVLGFSKICITSKAEINGATFRLVTSDQNVLSQILNRNQKVTDEEDIRKSEENVRIKTGEEKRNNNGWEHTIVEWLNNQEMYEYKHGIFFGDRRKITIVTQPITRRIWNAVINHNDEIDFDSNELVSRKNLGDFLKIINESELDLSQFDYLHNNPYAYGALSSRKVIEDKGIYLYLKD